MVCMPISVTAIAPMKRDLLDTVSLALFRLLEFHRVLETLGSFFILQSRRRQLADLQFSSGGVRPHGTAVTQ